MLGALKNMGDKKREGKAMHVEEMLSKGREWMNGKARERKGRKTRQRLARKNNACNTIHRECTR